MKRVNLPGMTKYGTVKEALRAIAKKMEDYHKIAADGIKKRLDLDYASSQVITK